ncbi:hypothetical protein MSAN_01565800 [Mycena sanguinolenta]|uniref:Uncharacterized protein n=1 Tax=Mycena sanguinolenta TaxID=230812 RepID=A0A8H7CXU3_9AGAR|nr:hypothetical protein MSAN_01565800 [Mycena sanguinolenta]
MHAQGSVGCFQQMPVHKCIYREVDMKSHQQAFPRPQIQWSHPRIRKSPRAEALTIDVKNLVSSKLENENYHLYQTRRCRSFAQRKTPCILHPSRKQSPRPPLPYRRFFPASLATPSTHDLVFPVIACRPPRASSLRPKLHLDTEWAAWAAPPRPSYLREIHSAGDVTGWRSRSNSNASLSTPCSSRKGSISTTSGTSSQEQLLPYCPSPDHDPKTEDLAHHGTSVPYVTVTKPASAASRSKAAKKPSACRFLNAVRPKLPAAPKLSTLVHTKRTVNSSNSSVIDNIVARPFMDSDPQNPRLGITVTVSRQCLVSKPMIMPLPDLEVFSKTKLPVSNMLSPAPSTSSLRSLALKSASAVSLVDLNLDKPLPTPTPSPPPTPSSTDDEDARIRLRVASGDNHKGGGDLIDMVSDPIDDQLPGTVETEDVPIALDLDPFAGVSADAGTSESSPPTGPQSDPDIDFDSMSDSDPESEPEVVEFKSRLSVTLTPATAMRMQLPKRRKRYTTHTQTV